MPEVRSPWGRYREYAPIGDDGMTEISHAASCDINYIVRRYTATGSLPPPGYKPVYADVVNLQGDLGERIRWSKETIERYNEWLAEQLAPKPSNPIADTTPTPTPQAS